MKPNVDTSNSIARNSGILLRNHPVQQAPAGGIVKSVPSQDPRLVPKFIVTVDKGQGTSSAGALVFLQISNQWR